MEETAIRQTPEREPEREVTRREKHTNELCQGYCQDSRLNHRFATFLSPHAMRSSLIVLLLAHANALLLPAAPRSSTPRMGLFDNLAKAFSNEDFKEDDKRVRASHILCKGDDDVERIAEIMAEIGQKVQQQPDGLRQIFADTARRESECSSKSMGGDLGVFGPGKMVPEFDAVLFPDDAAAEPPVGAIVGPVVTEFGCHVILVTNREMNRDQVEELLVKPLGNGLD